MADDFNLSVLNSKGYIKTYPTPKRKAIKEYEVRIDDVDQEIAEKREPLTTKNAIQLLLKGTLKTEVCRYCLNVTKPLSELDQIMQIASKGTLFKVTIRDMVASFHPIKVSEDINYPNKICNKCLDSTIKAYLYVQQCEQAERALRNCFDDMHEKLQKLDSIETPKKRGRRKANPNYNILYTEHEKVINYAHPIITLINTASEGLVPKNPVSDLECLKCCQVLPNVQSLLNHEKLHPKSMWYNCRICGKSFAKRYQIKRHLQSHLSIRPNKNADSTFLCKTCGYVNENYKEFLQHMEKHKFKTVMEHLLERRMDKLCSVCLDKGSGMVDLEKMICLHGGCPNLTGDRTLHSILASTLPDMNNLNNYTGTKICEKCLNHAINAYIFTNQFLFNRTRLSTCVTLMLENLNKVNEVENNIFVEISQNTIMPLHDEVDDVYLCDENDYIDEKKLKVDVLEDEYRIESDRDSLDVEDNPARKVTKTYTKSHLINGMQTNSFSICSEFLKFKSKPKAKRLKYTCPICHKHFITDYHLKRHIVKHVNRKVTCALCDNMFQSKFHMYQHMKLTHKSKQDNVPCWHCGRAVGREKIERHVAKHFNIVCELCDKVFATQNCYNIHMQRHVLSLNKCKAKHIVNCSFCEQEFVGDNDLYTHINKVHIQIKTYDCEMCEKKLYTMKNLKCHQKVHSLYSIEKCMFCSKDFKCRRDLVYHVWKHLGVTPFNCQFCGQSFRTKSKVKQHMKLYHGGNLCCMFCKKVFLTKYGLKDHIKNAHSFI